MNRNTNLGMSLGQLISGAFDGSAQQKGMAEGARINQLNADIGFKNAQADEKRQEMEARSDPSLIKSLVAGMQNGINGDNVRDDFEAYLGGSYKPREQQGPAMAPGSRMPAPEYASQFPELQQKFSGLKQMLALGDKNLPNLSKSIQGDQRNVITANLANATPQQAAEISMRTGAMEGNVSPMEQQKAAILYGLTHGQNDAESQNALLLSQGKTRFDDMSGKGAIDLLTGKNQLNDLGYSDVTKNKANATQSLSAADLNRAKVGQTISATDLNNANIGLAGAKTVNERSKAVPATTAPNGQAYSTKPIPTPALKMQQEELETIGTVSGTNADLATIKKQIEDGQLHLGTFKNYLSGAKNYLGASDETSQNYATLQATLEKARNSSLILNKGVQTDGDAKRAWNELITNLNDPEVVKKRLAEIQSINERAVKLRKAKVSNLRKNYNAPPLDYSEYDGADTAIKSGSNKKSNPSGLPSVSNW